jgi:hypothetical protein
LTLRQGIKDRCLALWVTRAKLDDDDAKDQVATELKTLKGEEECLL